VAGDPGASGPVACRICGHGIAIPSPSAKPASPPPRPPVAQARAPAPQGGGSAARKVAPLRAVPTPDHEATPTPAAIPTSGSSAWNDRAAGPALGNRPAPLPPPPGEGYIDLTIDDVPTPGPRVEEAPPPPATWRPPAARAPSDVPAPRPAPAAVPRADRTPAPAAPPLAARESPTRPAAQPAAARQAAAQAQQAARPRTPPAATLGKWLPVAGAAVVLLAAGGFLMLRGRSGPDAAAARAPGTARYVISTEPPPLAEAAPGVVEAPRAAVEYRPAPPAEPAVRRGGERLEPRRTQADRPAPAAEPAPLPVAQPMQPAAPAAVRVDPIQIAAAPAAPPPAPVLEDAPAYATAGFQKPRPEVPSCVQSALRIPADLQQFVSGPVTVRFAVSRDGAVSRFELMGEVAHPRIGDAIWQALRSCKFVPGADAQGTPTSLWLVMPIRFVAR
jgi:hypothetical protein